MLVMRVEGEEPLRARGVYGYVLPGGPVAVTPNARHQEGPRVSHDTVHSKVQFLLDGWPILFS
jgi:hypothetical protein